MRNVTSEQVIARMRLENPWWDSRPEISASILKYTPRPYLELFQPLVEDRSIRRAVVLLGSRRVGKTVMIHHSIQRLMNKGIDPKMIFYITVDHPLYNGLGLEELLALYNKAAGTDFTKDACYVFFDEIQYLRNWEIHLKAIVDSWESVKCIASGSAAAALRMKSSESGAGRFTDFLLPPLTFFEYLSLLDCSELVEIGHSRAEDFSTDNIERLNTLFIDYINYGGFPEVALSEEIRKDPGRYVKSDIIDKVLLRDLPGLYGIQDIQELNYLFTTLAYNTAGEVSLGELSMNSGASKNTLKRYIDYLEAAFLIRIVHRLDRNARRFKRARCFKVYLTNPSIRSALFQPVYSEDEFMGAMAETAVFSQWFHSNSTLYYSRWKSGEVDIIHLNPLQKVISAIEIKWSDRFYSNPGELRSLFSFCHENNLTSAIVTTKTKTGRIQIKSINIEFVPASLYCFGLGFNIIHSQRFQGDSNGIPIF
ncbi:MAG: ATP-binding protein [Candidatus Aegiribacteria sp.]|nr:ATP-binding protein [Candidatus Aegiribacteria sp.]